MDLEIIKEKELPMLSRKRVSLWISQKGPTPSRLELISSIAKKFNTKPEHVVIKHIYSQFGDTKSKIIAHLYADDKKRDLFEHKSLLDKHIKEKEPAKAEQAANG